MGEYITRAEIREAVPEDYPPIYSLIKHELGYADLDFGKLCVRLSKIKADDKQLTVVADVDGEVVGFMGISRYTAYNYEGEYLQIVALAVHEQKQNQGVGSQLTKWAEEYAAENKMPAVVLTSRLHRTDAHAFYERKGYTKASFGFRKDI